MQREQEMAENEKERIDKDRRFSHAVDIRNQVGLNDQLRRKARREFLQEGEQLRTKMSSEKVKLDTIKERKLDSLRGEGVPEKYTVELNRKKFS